MSSPLRQSQLKVFARDAPSAVLCLGLFVTTAVNCTYHGRETLERNYNLISWLDRHGLASAQLPHKVIPVRRVLGPTGHLVPPNPPFHLTTAPGELRAHLVFEIDPTQASDLSSVGFSFRADRALRVHLGVRDENGEWRTVSTLDVPAATEARRERINTSDSPVLAYGTVSALRVSVEDQNLIAGRGAHAVLDSLVVYSKGFETARPGFGLEIVREDRGSGIKESYRSLILTGTTSVTLHVRPSLGSKMTFLGRSLSESGAAVVFARRGLLKDRVLARFDLNRKWRAYEVSLSSLAGQTVTLTVKNERTASTAAISAFCFQHDRASPRRGAMLLVFDALRRDALTVYGYDKPTSPFLESAAAAVFADAYSPGPHTTWSIMGLLTSCWGPFLMTEFHYMPDTTSLLPKTLQSQGILTVGVSGNLSASSAHNFNQGYDLFVDVNSEQNGSNLGSIPAPAFDIEGEVERVLPILATSDFFFYAHFAKPHLPYTPTPQGFAPFDFGYQGSVNGLVDDPRSFLNQPWEALNAPDRRQIRALYDGSVRDCDAVFARIREKLDEQGILARTLLVVTADHGEYFGDHLGYTAYQQGFPGNMVRCPGNSHPPFLFNTSLSIPMLLWGPGIAPGRIHEQVSLVDLFPTFMDFLRITPDVPLQGRSLLPLLFGQKWDQRNLYATYRDPDRLAVAVISKDRKLTRYLVRRDERFVVSEELYSNITDPAREVELPADYEPARRNALQRDADQFLGRQLPLVESRYHPQTRDLSEEQIRRLRSLGYLQ